MEKKSGGKDAMTEKHEVTRQEILKRMAIKEADFHDYVKKISKFFDSLNEDERQFYIRNNGRTVEQIARSLGKDVTIADVELVFNQVPRVFQVCILACCGHNPPAPPPPNQ